MHIKRRHCSENRIPLQGMPEFAREMRETGEVPESSLFADFGETITMLRP